MSATMPTPEDFGAVGDGEADDTEAVQAFFDSLRPGSPFVRMPGIYRVSSTLRYPPGVTLGQPRPVLGAPSEADQ